MTHRSRPGRSFINLFLLTGLLAGCQTAPPTPAPAPPTRPPIEDHTLKTSLRNNSYALLYQLLEQEKDVSLLRFIKREHADLKDILKRIAADSAAGGKLLKKFAKDDPSIDLNAIRLPPGEVATRDAIAAHEQKEILHGKGEPFEMTMLLNQAEAVNYGEFLAQIAAQNEANAARHQALEALSEQMAEYHMRLVQLIALR